jgi:hypothetical protein
VALFIGREILGFLKKAFDWVFWASFEWIGENSDGSRLKLVSGFIIDT